MLDSGESYCELLYIDFLNYILLTDFFSYQMLFFILNIQNYSFI